MRCNYHEDGWGTCGAPADRRYLVGHRCPRHTPAAIAGRPEPGATAYTIEKAPHDPEPLPRKFPDADALPCVHCRRPVAPVNVALFGAAEHMACYPPRPRRAA